MGGPPREEEAAADLKRRAAEAVAEVVAMEENEGEGLPERLPHEMPAG